jgi:phosphoglycerol transferase MdoB-like AlkP superfamily enzyme
VLAAKGYRTTSYHSFKSGFFDRAEWYPLIGIQHSNFEEDVEAKGASACPNVFAGACDRDVPQIIGEQLRDQSKPQFIYWLTLNSHLPVIEDPKLGTTNCNQLGGSEDADFPIICRMYSVWDDTAAALEKMVSQPGFPPTDILIVGDHMPPFTHQKSRLKFDSEHVPWFLLKHREGQQAAPAHAQRDLVRSAG